SPHRARGPDYRVRVHRGTSAWTAPGHKGLPVLDARSSRGRSSSSPGPVVWSNGTLSPFPSTARSADLNGNATFRHHDTAVLSVTAVDAPVVKTSAEFDEIIGDSYGR